MPHAMMTVGKLPVISVLVSCCDVRSRSPLGPSVRASSTSRKTVSFVAFMEKMLSSRQLSSLEARDDVPGTTIEPFCSFANASCATSKALLIAESPP
jgi:hypothetical protein